MQLRDYFRLRARARHSGNSPNVAFELLKQEMVNLTSITLTVTGAKAQATVSGPLTSGMVGIPVVLEYDDAWNGLTKNLVCRCGKWGPEEGETRTILNIGERSTVAHEIMKEDMHLYLGIEGYSADRKLVIPSTWADCGRIQSGANADGDSSAEPSLSVWAQLQAGLTHLGNEVNALKRNPVVEDTDCLPEYSEADNGKVLVIVDGSPAWVMTSVSGSGGDSKPTTHGIIWDLVNVTSSNNVASVSDGLSLIAILTAAEGYILGDVTVTMGGEVLTGVWNADTATIAVASVTSDVVISCAGVEKTVTVDTSPKIAAENTAMTNTTGVTKAWEGLCVTEPYAYALDVDAIKASSGYDAENDYVSTATILPSIVIYNPATKYIEAGGKTSGIANSSKPVYFRDGEHATYTSAGTLVWGETLKEATAQLPRQTTNALYSNSVKFVLSMLDKEDAYAYWTKGPWDSVILPIGVREGDIIFAGKNTPYYGMKNIDGSTGENSGMTTAAEAIDNDYAMDYSVATLSLVTDEAENLATDTGLNAEWAVAVETAKNAWMLEANGNVDKIPLIIHTDQHGRYSKPLYDTISKIVNWYDISKVVNLGDTVNAWADADTDNPLTICTTLETYLEATQNIPNSKRIEVFGNHDVWGQDAEGNNVGYAPQNHLRKYFRNIYARCCDNYGNFEVKDDTYNVKYLVVSAFAFDFTQSGRSTYAFAPDSLRWIISEMEKVDGYDVIILSHVPLGATSTTIYDPVGGTSVEGDISGVTFKLLDDLWSARRDKTSGSVTDAYGNAYDFDFTACDGSLLCGLHGHYHADGYYYIGNMMDAYFSSFNYNNKAISFVLVDRENRRLNVWRVDSTPQVQNYQIPFDKPTE